MKKQNNTLNRFLAVPTLAMCIAGTALAQAPVLAQTSPKVVTQPQVVAQSQMANTQPQVTQQSPSITAVTPNSYDR